LGDWGFGFLGLGPKTTTPNPKQNTPPPTQK